MMADEENKAKTLLAGAYALESGSDNVDYYREFAPIYEDQYVSQMGYTYPYALAEVYQSYSTSRDLPVADIGCGTGLVATALELPVRQIDGIDISPHMLSVAQEKSIYRNLYQVDLNKGTNGLPKEYGAVVSAGTFTFGHLGPELLPELLSLARKDALFCIGVNSRHFEQQGFTEILTQLDTMGKITTPDFMQHQIYTGNQSEHAGDLATIVVYRKLSVE